MKTFTCKKCDKDKPIKDFRVTPTKRGHSLDCKVCYAEYMREYYKNKPEQYQKHKGYVKINDESYRKIWFKYGLSKETFDKMFAKYNGLCWSCKESPINSIDHDHKCCPAQHTCGDCVRGMLCNGCNSGLGHLKDSVDRIDSLKEYLISSRGVA